MDKLEDLISDSELDEVFGEANFGDRTHRQIIKETLLKCVCGYHAGSTATHIVIKLHLVTPQWNLTNKGKAYLYTACIN